MTPIASAPIQAMIDERRSCALVGRSSSLGLGALCMRFLLFLCAGDVSGDLLVGQQHAQTGHDDIRVGALTHEIGAAPPIAHDDQDHEKREKLAQLDAHVERQKVGQKPILGNLVLEDLRGETGAMEEAEDQRRRHGVWLESQPLPERTEVVERLVDHRQPDDGVYDIGVYAPSEPYAEKHGDGMAKSEQADVNRHVLHVIQEEDDAQKKQDMV